LVGYGGAIAHLLLLLRADDNLSFARARTPLDVLSRAGKFHRNELLIVGVLAPTNREGTDSEETMPGSRVPRPEHLNPWQAGRNYSITSSARASNAHGTVPCGN